MAYNFMYYSPTKVYFGRGEEKNIAEYIKSYNAHQVMIVYGKNSVKKSGLLKLVEDLLEKEHIHYSECGGVVPNPELGKVYEGIELGKKNGTDFLLAIGGGSVIDTAKAIGYGLAEPEKDVWELYMNERQAKACLPVSVILTISAAGSETSKSSVITNEKTHEKRSYDDNLARPKFAIMNPELTMSLSDYQTEAGCTDIMMHTMERYFTNGGNMEITDAIAEGLLRTVKKNALILHHDPYNYDARAEVMWAGSLAHNDLTGCGNDGGDFMSHKLEHELSGMFHVTHGAGLAAIWPTWAQYVYKNCLPRFVKFALNVMGIPNTGSDEEIALNGIHAMEDFYHDIGMPTNLKELGIAPTDEEIEKMADQCLAASGTHCGSAMRLSKEDMIQIYKNARR